MNKFLAIILFPFFWLSMYLYRLIWFDIIDTLIRIVLNLFISPLASLWLLVTLQIVIIIEIPVGLIATLLGAIGMCADVFTDEIDIASAFKMCFTKKHDNT